MKNLNPNLLPITALCLLLLSGGVALFKLLLEGEERDLVEKQPLGSDGSPAAMEGTRSVRRRAQSDSQKYGVVMDQNNVLAAVERDRMTSNWTKQALVSFGLTKKRLSEDLGLDAEQNEELEKVFDRRAKRLETLLLKMSSVGSEDGMGLVKEICAVIRNKGLRDELVDLLSDSQLQAFDSRNQRRQQDQVEARAYRDMAEVNSVVQLSDSQKQQVLDAMIETAPERLELEADARAFMSLTLGALAEDIAPGEVRGMRNLMNMDPSEVGPMEFGDESYEEWAQEQNANRIENELSSLQAILDEDQLALYRRHLESYTIR
ncbi:MAG: hypothetical protein ACON4R_08860 [Akkermansiaceae bacterium]